MEEDQFRIPDLRPYVAARPNFFPPPEILPSPFDLLVFPSDSTNATAAGAGRWPRQETLTLLEIRSRLDPKFREANQKTALWDEVSRIMCDEYGYQRSGKKCREKFENLYKYYKKTKDGKAGRQDGRSYRFFRQLEALCGETSVSAEPYHPQPQMGFDEALVEHVQQPRFSDNSLSLCNYSESETASSDEAKTGWKAEVKGFVDVQMKKLMEKQESWMEEMAAAVEKKERERAFREEEWRRQDAERVEREREFWAGERAWIEARDASLMEALRKITGKELVNDDRNKIEGFSMVGNEFWEDVGDKMSRLGSDRCSKKRKEESKSCGFFDEGSRNRDGDGGLEQRGLFEAITRLSDDQSNGNDNNINESCLRYFMGDAYGRII